MAQPRPLILITPGDPDGIGPEIVCKAMRLSLLPDTADYVCIGAEAPFTKSGASVELTRFEDLQNKSPRQPREKLIRLIAAPTESDHFLPGFQSGWAVEKAVELIRGGHASALVTGPISKTRLNQGGYSFPGHTELLSSLCSDDPATPLPVTMMLANDQLRVTLATTHVALSDVSRALSRDKLRQTILHTASHLQNWWGIAKPRIAIAGLNPHAGEGGLFGDEEQQTIIPAIKEAQNELGSSAALHGPFPSDTLFAKHIAASEKERFDAVVCMYHDQGLIPVKLLDFPRTVNVTLGLPMIRTSVDHGVGFDIVGKNAADPSSFIAAVRLAVQLAEQTRSRL